MSSNMVLHLFPLSLGTVPIYYKRMWLQAIENQIDAIIPSKKVLRYPKDNAVAQKCH